MGIKKSQRPRIKLEGRTTLRLTHGTTIIGELAVTTGEETIPDAEKTKVNDGKTLVVDNWLKTVPNH